MRRPKRNHDEVFGMSFLDVVSCGFGAMVAILMLSKNAPEAPVPVVSAIRTPSAPRLESSEIALLETAIDSQAIRNADLVEREEKLKARLAAARSALEIASSEAQPAPVQSGTKGTMASDYNGGIPVDATHIVFVIDSSGSMKANWHHVVATVQQLLAVHPEVEAIQVLSDMGESLIPGYENRWIPDNPSARKNFNQSLANMSAFSNSSPVEGIERALRIYAPKADRLAVYVLGDDFTGDDFEKALRSIDRLNSKDGKPLARIHAIGFPWGVGHRYATLMREVVNRHDGVYLGM